MKKILLIDNYDSFTYNLVHLIKEVSDVDLDVRRNNKISLEELNNYDRIVISPGPGIPDEAGIIKEAIKHFASTKKILGICLGHQAIAEVFDSKIINMKESYHGVGSNIELSDKSEILFKNVPDNFIAGRYHSWVVQQEGLSEDLIVTAKDKNGMIMALSHRHYDVKGIQFHPESILTEHGKTIMGNWINEC